MMWLSLKNCITDYFRGLRPTRVIVYTQGKWYALTVGGTVHNDVDTLIQLRDAIKDISAKIVGPGIGGQNK